MPNQGGQRLGKGILGKTPKALKGRNTKQLTRQAKRLTNALYKPALHDLRTQQRRTNAISEKRATDNKYYLDWLATQTAQLRAHADAGQAQLQASQQDIQTSAQESMASLQSQLVTAAGQNVGNVSNPGQAAAHDVSPEAQRGSDLIANERMRSNQQVASNRQTVDTGAASNFALMAASEARRQADQFKALKDIGDARQKVKLERAAKASEEVARLLDQEIAKAQSRMDLRAQAAQLGLSLKDFKLRRKEFGFNKKFQMAQLDETIRSNMAGEALTRQSNRLGARDDRADNRNDRRDDRRDRSQHRNENRQEQRGEQRELQHQVKRAVNNNVSTIASSRKLQRLLNDNPNEVVRKLVKMGAEPIFARAAVDLTRFDHLRQHSIRNLRNLGFNIPPNWRS